MWVVRIFLSFFLCVVFCCAQAQPVRHPAYYKTNGEVQIPVDLYLSSTCPHCKKAAEFFKELETTESWIVAKNFEIDEDKDALEAFYARLEVLGSTSFAVPAIFFCDTRWTGFDRAETTGKILLKALHYCRNQIIIQGEITPGTKDVLKKWAAANEVTVGPSITESPAKFILFTSFMDAMNPCAIFSLGLFFSFLWLYPRYRTRQLAIGLLFIVAFTLSHYLEQTYSTVFYQPLGWLRIPAIVLGLIILAYVFRYSKNRVFYDEDQSIEWIYLFIPFVAVIVQTFQERCDFNIALVFEQWLIKVNATGDEFLRVVYQFLFSIPLLLLLILYIFLNQTPLIKRYQNGLKIAGTLNLLVVGILLIAYPYLLSNFTLSLVVFFGSIVVGCLFVRRYE